MAATAVIAGVAILGTAVSVEQSQQTRRLAGQAQDRQKRDMEVAEMRRAEGVKQVENQEFSKIQRQRQRALANNTTVAPGATTGASGSSFSATPATAVSPTGSGKTTLGS